MVGIWDFEALEQLEAFIERGTSQAIAALAQELDDDNKVLLLREASLERIFIVGEWGKGTAERGQDALDVLLFFDTDIADTPSEVEEFRELVGVEESEDPSIPETLSGLINEGAISPDPVIRDTFAQFRPIGAPIDRLPENISNFLGRREGNLVADLERREAIQFVEPQEPQDAIPGETQARPVPFEQLPRIPFEELRERSDESFEEDEEEEPEPEDEGEEDEEIVEEEEEPPEEEPEPLSAREAIEQRLEQFAIDDTNMEVPAGKPTRRVQLRDLYDFEIQLAVPSDLLGSLEGFAPGDQLTGGIGFLNEFRNVGEDIAPGTFPRVGNYVKYYLRDFGPDYTLNIYRNLVVYSGFISAFYGADYRPGSYRAFREYMYRLKEVGERGGPKLVVKLSPTQANQLGLDTTPEHPTIPGEKAPWLEDRQYYDLVEENIDSQIWNDPAEFLYGDED